MAMKFDQTLFTEIIRNAKTNGYLIQTDDGKVKPLTEGVKGTVINPVEAIKGMLFGDTKDADDLAKSLIISLGGKLKSGPSGKRGRKPKAATA